MTRKLALLAIAVLTAASLPCTFAANGPAEDHPERKIVKKVAPEYPALARRLHMKGAVKLLVTVQPGGGVVSAKPVGGNPVLLDAAMNVIGKWRFEPAPDQSTVIVEMKFESIQ
jgi:TonB family protein